MKIRVWLFILIAAVLELSSCNSGGVGPVIPATPEFTGMDGKLVTRLVYRKPYLYAGAAANGLWRRDMEKMTNWEYIGLADTSLGNWGNVGVMDIDVLGSDLLVAYNGSAPSIDPKSTIGIWRSTDGGTFWLRSDSGIPESITDPYQYNVISTCRRSPDKPDIAIAIYVIATYRSTNGGNYWSLISGQPGLVGGDDHMRWNPLRAGEYWTWGSTSVYAPYLIAFTNYGSNAKLSVNFNSLGFASDGFVSDVAFDCGDPDVIHAATYGGLIRSTDGGTTWSVRQAVIPDSGYVFTLVEHPIKPGVLFLAGGSSVYYSLDRAETMRVLANVPVSFIECLAIDEERGRLFVGSSKGVYSVSFLSVVNDYED